MAPSTDSLCKRLQQVRSSLDKAEASFSREHHVRGELDLLLAEAELKNLRRKQGFSWSRQLLALGAAVLLALAGLGGWYCAQRRETSAAFKQPPMAQSLPEEKASLKEQPEPAPVAAPKPLEPAPPLKITPAEMQHLVQSARAELNNSQ